MLREYLSIVSLKDVLLVREVHNGHGRAVPKWVVAGEGMVDWSAVFAELKRITYDGPLTVHAEFKVPEAGLMDALRQEVRQIRRYLQQDQERSLPI